MIPRFKYSLAALSVIGILFISGLKGANGTTYYVRPDGGTSTECTGLKDAPYPGTGNNQPCAWAHPFWAVDGNDPPSWKIQGGDTLVIYPGQYRMGMGAPNSSWCSPYWPWDCHLPPLPSGPDADHPTRILGAGWDQGCLEPPQLWGTERTEQIIGLEGISNAVVSCLELTDHSGCIEFHADPKVACKRDEYPFGDWASTGIYAADSDNVRLQDVNIHGLASEGIRAGRISNWTVANVRIAGNGWVGWEGDLGEESSNSGTLTFLNWIVEWNGCAETYPDQDFAHCWAQPVGGYGDGVGTARTGGHWIIEDSIFRYNTSDGLDLLYVREAGSTIEIRRTMAYANAGNQIKTTGSTKMENCLLIGNCGYFADKPFAPAVNGQPSIDHCRAGGAALALTLIQGSTVSVVNSTIVGEGDCLTTVECDWQNSLCDGTETVIVQNNIFRGYEDFLQPGDQSCYFWIDPVDLYNVQWDYNVIYQAKLSDYLPALGAYDFLEDPLFINENLDEFNGHLQPASPAVDSGIAVGGLNGLIPDHDLQGIPRPQLQDVDRGAYEYRPVPAPDFDLNAITDITVWRPTSGQWYGKDPQTNLTFIKGWGINGDIPFCGDFDADGQTDPGVWRPANGIWYVLLSSFAYSPADSIRKQWGTNGDLPIPADYDGDGRTDLGVWRPLNGIWYIKDMDGNIISIVQWGASGDIPVPGDYDGDGKADLGIWRPSNGTWYVKSVAGNPIVTTSWGIDGDVPVPADFDGDGKTDLGIWRPLSGMWYIKKTDGTEIVRKQYGINGDIPLAGDYDGDARADITIFRPITGQWFVRSAGSGFTDGLTTTYGSFGDLPLGCTPFSTTKDYCADMGYY